MFDLGSSIYNGYSSSAYLEQDMNKNVLTDVNTYIKDNNKTYAFEANYIKKWDKSSLTLGTSYSARRNKSTYKYLDNSVYHQRNDEVYFFSEYMQRIKYVTLTGGLGATYVDYKFHETGKGNNSWNFTPQFTAVYRPNSVSQFRVALRSWQFAPSLSQTNITAQQTDGIQWTIGNASLKSSRSYNLALRYSFNLPVVTGSVGTSLFSSPDAIAPYMYWDNDKLFTSYENSKGLKYVRVWFSPQVEVIPHWFYLSGTISYKAENMKGTGYSLYNHTWSGEVTAMLRHKNFAMTVQYRKASRDLFGETVDWGEDFSLVDLRYNLDKWQFGAGCFMPFGKYDQGKVSYNKYYSYEYHLRPDVRFFYVRVAYNLQWGRQKKGVNKMVNANTGTDTSTAASR